MVYLTEMYSTCRISFGQCVYAAHASYVDSEHVKLVNQIHACISCFGRPHIPFSNDQVYMDLFATL